MSTHGNPYDFEITPERVAEVTRRARRERSQAFWRLLESLFRNRSSQERERPAGPAKAVQGRL